MNNKDIPEYNHKSIELQWQEKWQKSGLYKTPIQNASKPYYNLMMYPYPSAEGLHVGNVYAFVGSDIHGRFQRMQGYDVFEPIGFDSGGIHSENFAIKMGVHPRIMTEKNIANFTKQLKKIGNMFDWDHSVDVMDPNYYRWTQWVFTQLFKAGLAYKKDSAVTWCPGCKTTISDEQTEIINEITVCERCKTPIERKQMKQWFFRITDYAQRLLDNTGKLNWTSKVINTQRNWIGRSEGINIIYEVENSNEKIICFTTRPDTNFGATFIVLAPEHPAIPRITAPSAKNKVDLYVKKSLSKTELERIAEGTKKTGVFTGSYVINKLNGLKLPIWVSDFVLGNVGTGAVVGVPGHDIRDFQFAQVFNIPITRVVVGKDGDKSAITKAEQVQESEGLMINSQFLDGLDIHKATQVIMDYLEEKGWGKRQIHYKLRDWNISRQRYWGPPIPMIYCEACAKNKKSWFNTEEAKYFNNKFSNLSEDYGWFPVPDELLPVLLPDINDYLPDGSGKAPLARHLEFYQTKCPYCGGKAIRETDVSDTFMDSSWYFLRYPSTAGGDIDAKVSNKAPFDTVITKKWLPVSQYCGGAEHSVLHLMYSRFITMVLHDLRYLDFEEPFPNFYAHGLLIKDGAKMSKSRGNVVNPDDYIEKYGTDVLRLYLSFMGPYGDGGDFRDSGIAGMQRFVKRIWRNFYQWQDLDVTDKSVYDQLERMMHISIWKVTRGIKNFKYNTSIAALMEFMNKLEENAPFYILSKTKNNKLANITETFLLLLAPLAPHISEQLWHLHKDSDSNSSVHLQSWPIYIEDKMKSQTTIIAIQINGKLRATIEVPTQIAMDKAKLISLSKKHKSVVKYLDGKKIIREIVIPLKLVNYVTL